MWWGPPGYVPPLFDGLPDGERGEHTHREHPPDHGLELGDGVNQVGMICGGTVHSL